MNIKPIITGVLLLLAVAGVVAVFWQGNAEESTADTGTTVAADGLPTDGVVVYYFHGHKRCFTCNKMEALADEAIWQDFQDLVNDGSVVFKAVNIETDADRHFIGDYELVNKVVVMSERRDGQEVSWQRLDLVWEKIADDEAYRAYITENLAASLERVGVEAG